MACVQYRKIHLSELVDRSLKFSYPVQLCKFKHSSVVVLNVRNGYSH